VSRPHSYRAPRRGSWDADYGAYMGAVGDPRNEDATECPVCDGMGWRWVSDDGFAPYRETCPCCEGARFLDDEGMPLKEDA
jgi:hypothetical protein